MYNTAAVIAGTPEIGLHDLAGEAERMALNLMMTMDQQTIREAHARSKDFEARYLKNYLRGYVERKRSDEEAQQEP